MAGYEDTRQMIINTLTNRLAGTEIQPEDHQEFALAITDYVRSVELLSGNAFIGFAEANTTPVQSDKGQCFYISTVGPGQTVNFVNFIDSNGNVISVSSPDSKMSLVTLIWNTQYWSSQVTTIDTNWSIAQQSGDSESMVMSQKAVTDAIAEAINKLITTDRIENGAVTSEKIATSAFDSTLSVSGKIAPADIVGEKITKLKEKVDALALGKFYGYFPDYESLPTDVTTSGYAYVGTDNPYEIWNFNGESWSDSGTYIDMNDADEEDITRNTDGKLQLKDRSYGDGMGYVILRKDKTFAEQVTNENTIYEIRYHFNLGGASATIPANCVLKFVGGSISNGTLALNNSYLDGNPKILCNVSGSISNKTNDVTFFGIDNTGHIDCSARLQHLLSALGAVHFPQGAFLVTNQVIMPKTARMTGEGRGSVIKIVYDGYAFLYPYDSQIANNWFQYSFRDISVQGDYPVIEDETTPKTKTSFLQTENGTYPLSMEVIGCYFTKLYCAFNIEQAYWTRIDNSIFFYMGDAIIVSECNSSVFTNNMFRGCKGTAITINPRQRRDSSVATGTLGMTISGNDFSESLNAGIRVFCKMQNCEISGNYFESMANGAWQQIVVGDPVKKYGVTAMISSCSIVGNSGMWQERGGIKVVNGEFNGNIYQGYVNIDDDSVANRNIGCSTNKQSALLLGYVNGNVIANANPFGIESKIRQYSAKHVVIPANSTLILRDISIACYSDFRVLFFQSASIPALKLRISGIAESDIDITSMEEPHSWFSATNRYTLAAKIRNVTLSIVNLSENCMITDIDLIMSYNLYRDK